MDEAQVQEYTQPSSQFMARPAPARLCSRHWMSADCPSRPYRLIQGTNIEFHSPMQDMQESVACGLVARNGYYAVQQLFTPPALHSMSAHVETLDSTTIPTEYSTPYYYGVHFSRPLLQDVSHTCTSKGALTRRLRLFFSTPLLREYSRNGLGPFCLISRRRLNSMLGNGQREGCAGDASWLSFTQFPVLAW